MKQVLITGATGFVGVNLLQRLIRDGHNVHLLVRPKYSSWRIDSLKKNVQIHEVDFYNREEMDTTIWKIKPEWIFHLATHGAYSWQQDLYQIVNTNIMGTTNLVEACIKTGFDAFINTGSSSEYGFKNHPTSEQDYLEPNSYYAVTKAFGTQFCRYCAQSKNVNIHTLRLYSVYGPFEEPTRFMPTLIIKGLDNQLPSLVNPNVARDYIYVEDVVDAFIACATQKVKELGGVYNVGTGIQTSIQNVVEIACQTLGIKAKPQWGTMSNRIWDTNIWIADNSKIIRELGWQPKYTFKDGFQRMIEWFHDNPQFISFYKKSINKE